MKYIRYIPILLVLLSGFITASILLRGDYRCQNSERKPSHIQETESDALAAIQFWTRQRAYPFDHIKESLFSQEFEKKMRKDTPHPESKTESWKSIGPTNRGGRMISLAFNPQNPKTIYAGSASGGLWRSFNQGEGASWHRISTGHPTLGVGAIAFNPSDSNYIFIGMGEVYRQEASTGGLDQRTFRGSYGNGILRSSDGGVSWDKVLDWEYSDKQGVQVIRVNPQRPNSVWAGTSRGLYRSLNGGDSWELMKDLAMITDIEINPLDTNVIHMSCGNFYSSGHGIYRSIDGGINWIKATGELPASYGGKALLSMSPENPDIVYAGIGNGYSSGSGTWLCKTTDGGVNWMIVSDVNYSSYQGWFAHDVAVYPNDPDTVLCFGVYGWRSDDGGYSMNKITSIGTGTNIHVDFHALEFQPGSPRTFYIASDGGIYRSQDLGNTFDRLDAGLVTTQFYNGFSNSVQDPLKSLGGLQDNGTYKFVGIDNWVYENGGDGSWTAIDPTNDDILYVSSQYLRISKSTNGGASFNTVSPPEVGAVSFIAPFVLAPNSPTTIYAGRSRVYKSLNGGSSWTAMNYGEELDGNPVLSMAVSYQNQNKIYVATAPRYGPMKVFLSTNGGNAWTNIRGGLPERYPVDLAVNPTNDSEVYIALSGFGSPHLYKSTNSGFAWIDISQQLPDVPTSAVEIDPLDPQHIFVGNDLGVYYSEDGGENWILFSDGLPEVVMVKDLKISIPSRKLRLATHGNGAYEIQLPQAVSSGKLPENETGLKVWPIPVVDEINLEFWSPRMEEGVLSLFNLSGKCVFRSSKTLLPGINQLNIKDIELSNGYYLLEIRTEDRSRVVRIVK